MIFHLIFLMILRVAIGAGVPGGTELRAIELFRAKLQPVGKFPGVHGPDALLSPSNGLDKVGWLIRLFVPGMLLEQIDAEPGRKNTVLVSDVLGIQEELPVHLRFRFSERRQTAALRLLRALGHADQQLVRTAHESGRRRGRVCPDLLPQHQGLVPRL